MPMASTMPNMVSTLMGYPASSITVTVPIRAIGTTMVGMRVLADVLEEQEHHHEDQHHRLDEGHHDLLDRGLDAGVMS